jgi:5'-methylthioadenosine phosphorylase
MPLGVIGGSSFLESSLFSTLEVRNVPTKYGDCRVRVSHDGQLVFIQRHEPAHPTSTCTYLPPHAIQHKAHIAALQAIGVQHVIGFASVGSLHSNISVGTVLVPDDFYLPGNSVEHFAQDHAAHM